MKTVKISEWGYDEAMLGLSLSWTSNPNRSEEIAPALSLKQGGHNKFIESMIMWLDITAPRYWWQEFDTYRVGVTKQSASTMHTITKRTLEHDDFEMIDGVVLDYLNEYIQEYQYETDSIRKQQRFHMLKNLLPEGFLQRRIVCMSYKTMQNIYKQRMNHRLPEWKQFFEVIGELNHPEFIRSEDGRS